MKDADITASWRTRYGAACAVLAPYLLLGVLPAVLWVSILIDLQQRDLLAFDFHQFFYPQARDLLEGRTPQTAYPPLTSLFWAPFATLPPAIADVVVTAMLIACAAATLFVLGIRDWRCYGAAALWGPVYAAVQSGNLSLVFALGVALLWRFRAKALPAGVLVALMIAMKLFLWPLVGWLAATRRWRAAAIVVGSGLLASAAAWAVIGFDTVTRFPELLLGNVEDNGSKPYTVTAFLQEIGAPAALGYAVCWAIGVVVLVAAIRAARRNWEAVSLTLFIGAALIASPIVWSHYLALLLVPVALARPRFSWLWLLPLPILAVPQVGGTLLDKLLLMTVGAAVVVISARALVPANNASQAAIAAEPAIRSEPAIAGGR